MTTKGYRLQIGNKNPPFGVGPYQVNYNKGIKSTIVNKIAVIQDEHPEMYKYPDPNEDFKIHPDRHMFYMFTTLEILKNIFGDALEPLLEVGFEVWEHTMHNIPPDQKSFSGLQFVGSIDQLVESNKIELTKL